MGPLALNRKGARCVIPIASPSLTRVSQADQYVPGVSNVPCRWPAVPDYDVLFALPVG